jgi:uncharacterized protein YggE
MQPRLPALLLALVTVGWPLAAAGQAPQDRYISVVGDGTANVVPDLAVIQTGVTTQAKTAREASDANSMAMTKVQAALKAGGISDRDVQTDHFSIRPVHDSRPDGDNRIVGFEASNQIAVKVRALAQVASILDRVIAAGANDMGGIQFVVSERSTLLDKARAEAVADARRKAQVLAKAAGVRLGRATVIVEDNASAVPIQRMTLRAAPAASVPVSIGEQTLRVHVSVTFELLQ